MKQKKTGRRRRRSGRGDKESFGGCGRDEGEDRDVLSRTLQRLAGALVQL